MRRIWSENCGEVSSALIYAIAVTSQYRSLGIGKQLINAIYKELRQKQIKKLFLHVCYDSIPIKGIKLLLE